MARVAMAMSGGVDSSVAAALLKEQGHEVIGLHMKLYHGPENEKRPKSCCSLDESIDARTACHRLDIPFYVLDYQKEFRELVIDYFVNEYSHGSTPNPCVTCNKKIKGDLLIKKVDELDCDYLATGHYARISFNQETGRSQLARPQDLRKDQTYFLHGITAHELQRLMFPLEDIIKPEVRKIASKLNLSAAKKPDSQEICFVPKDYRIFLKQELSQVPESGEFVSVSGKILGMHLGLPFYTIGQRRGLGLSDSTPYYVVKIDKENNRVVIGKEEDLYSQTTWVSGVNWVSISPPEEPLCVSAKLRYAHHGAPATVFPESENQVRLEFDAPERAVTPGQAAVLYQDEVLLGGGWINDSP